VLSYLNNQIHSINQYINIKYLTTRKLLEKLSKYVNDLQPKVSERQNKEYILKFSMKSLVEEKTKTNGIICKYETRIEELKSELKRVQDSTQLQYIDSDIWIRQVMKRMRTNDLKKLLETELEKQIQLLKETTENTTNIESALNNSAAQLLQLRKEIHTLSTITELLTNLSNQSNLEQALLVARNNILWEEQQFRLYNHRLKAIEEGSTLPDDLLPLAERVRSKYREARTTDEQDFILLDSILYPEHCSRLNQIELEELNILKKQYFMDIKSNDLHRIFKLPEQVFF
jgi:hypothetical protein